MERAELGDEAAKTAQDVLGYLNFSSGSPDPGFLRKINRLFELLDAWPTRSEATWRVMGRYLRQQLVELNGATEAFREAAQAEAVLALVFDTVLSGYHAFHRDLLFHMTDEGLFQPFFIGRVCEAVLLAGSPWDETERITKLALATLNDYVGHRPIAVLRSQQKIQPYAHEWVRPIPLFVRGAGVGVGRYHDLVSRALLILEATDPAVRYEAMFDLELLDELAVDPRAYDFDHPVNKRPNYLFGQWDLGKLDNSGRARRFVVQRVSLEAMLDRIEHRGTLTYDEMLFEAAAVLAGTMLMGARVSGSRPDAHDSTTNLASLLQQIAHYRDTFYDHLLAGLKGPHAERLRAEATSVHQPFGGVRQHFNQHLARKRAEQLQHVHLAEMFARMGYTEAAQRQAHIVPVASARMRCDIHCRLTLAHLALDAVHQGPSRSPTSTAEATAAQESAANMLKEAIALVHRGIECGALIDPWNILGFGAQYSLFPSPENSVYDHRADEMIALLSEIFAVGVQIQKEAAAAGNGDLETLVSKRLDELAMWWDKFATMEVSSVESFSGRETRESANHVTAALRAWHKAGTAAGDLAFWRSRAEQFRSPKAYALVVDALLEQHDPVASMALLVQWVSQAEQIPLSEEAYSFHELTVEWMGELWHSDENSAENSGEDLEAAAPAKPSIETVARRWSLTRKFLDYLEANAEEYWEVPHFELAGQGESEEADGDDIFSAAYEGVTFRDSTDDGVEGEMMEGSGGSDQQATDFELVGEAERIIRRLTFLSTLAQLWKMATVSAFGQSVPADDRDAVLSSWLEQAVRTRQQLIELLAAVYRYRIEPPRGTQEALIEFDRRRGVKEMLLENIIAACMEVGDAARLIRVAIERPMSIDGAEAWEAPAEKALRAVLRGDAKGVKAAWQSLITVLVEQPLLYVALGRGGHPQRIVASRGLQAVLRRLLSYLPRLGLLKETTQLIATIQEMESGHPVGPGAITEFDQMFKIGCRAIVRALVASSELWLRKADSPTDQNELIAFLEQASEALLRSWLVHSRGVRLSVLEAVTSKGPWNDLKKFIEEYGADLFTQRFMNLPNLRAILHQGVEAWLDSLAEEPDEEGPLKLMEDLDARIPREEAVRWLTVAMEAAVENYAEYIDYNSTTTQSDRGDMLYTLLDFLRLRASYDRVAWNLQPVILAHEVLVRSRYDAAAETWRAAVAERTSSLADDHLKKFVRLNRKYGMRLPSIADRLGERFIRPMLVDRLCAMVRPAVEAAAMKEAGSKEIFARLEEGIEAFTRDISGAGFDVPPWLEALEQEVDRVLSNVSGEEELPDPDLPIVQVRLTREELAKQMKAMGS
jgi:hypothetical protein